MKGPPAGAPTAPFVEIAVRFAAAGADRLQVMVDTPAGGGDWHDLAMPLDAAEAERLAHQALLGASHRRRGEEPARRLGQALFDALFARRALGRYHATLGPSRADAAPLRLRFHLGAGGAEQTILHRLPWELLCEPGHGDGRLLALDRHLSVVRHLVVADGVAMPPRPPRLRVLVAVAEGRAPGDAPDRRAPDLGGEADAIRAACPEGVAVAVDVLRPASLDALIERLRHGDVDVLHLIGHGELTGDDGVFLLPDGGGRLHPVNGEALAAQLDRLSPLRLVVLNACRTAESVAGRPFAGVAGAFLARGLPAVVAMQAPITDAAAAAFATALYRRLAAGAGLDTAVAEGRLAISRRRRQTFEWAVPVLFSRLTGGELYAAPAAGGAGEAREEEAEAKGAEAETAEAEAASGGRGTGRATGTGGAPPVAASRPRPVPPRRPPPRRLLALLALAASLLLVVALVVPWLASEPATRPLGGETASSWPEPSDAVDPEGAAAPAHDEDRAAGDGSSGASPNGSPGNGAAGGAPRRAEPLSAGDGAGSSPAAGAPAVRPASPPDDGARARRPETAETGVAGSFCGPVRTLRSGDAVEVPEIGATLVPRILDERGLGAYLTVSLAGLPGAPHRTTARPDTLDFADDAPLVVRVLDFDRATGLVRLSCHLRD